MGLVIDGARRPTAQEFTANLAQAAGTYDLCTASGDVLINEYDLAVLCTVVGATFTSVSIQSDQTTPEVLLSSAEGAVANLTASKNIVRAVARGSFILRSGNKIQYTIAGSTGTGTLVVGIPYTPLTVGASIA